MPIPCAKGMMQATTFGGTDCPTAKHVRSRPCFYLTCGKGTITSTFDHLFGGSKTQVTFHSSLVARHHLFSPFKLTSLVSLWWYPGPRGFSRAAKEPRRGEVESRRGEKRITFGNLGLKSHCHADARVKIWPSDSDWLIFFTNTRLLSCHWSLL